MSDAVRQLNKAAKRVTTSREVRISSNEKLGFAGSLKQVEKDTSGDSTNLKGKAKIDKIWKQIDAEFKAAQKKEPVDKNKGKKQAHKAIRIFVSSTFTDFFNEREILVKQVFPELKEWCALRRLDLVECDLRWGVPIDSTNDETIITCMSELDRCYQDNGEYPFFIGMASERYGWIPKVENLSPKILEKYQWVSDVSITFMEFLHGAIRSNNKNACFFLRQPESLDELPVKQKDRFFDSEEFSKSHLIKMKDKLREYFPGQVFQYSCKYDGIDDSTGRPKVKLNDYVNFAEKAVEFFKEAIARAYPDMQPMQNLDDVEDLAQQYEIEDCYQDNFMDERSKFYVERVKEEMEIKSFIKNEPIPESMSLHVRNAENETEAVHDSNSTRNLLITGKEGNGKTNTMIHLVQDLLSSGQNVFHHFFEASIKSNDMEAMAARFIQYFSKILNLKEKDYLKDFISTFHSDKREGIIQEIIALISQSDKQFTIILDGMDSYPDRQIKYIPRSLPKNVSLIVTADEKAERMIESLLEADTWYRMQLPNMDYDLTKTFIVRYLERYNKKLDDKQLKLLLDKEKDALSPLWLNFACYELRVFGDHATLAKKIQDLPATVVGLLSHIFIRLNKEFGEDLIKKLLCLIETSDIGIAESEAPSLLGNFGEKQELDRLKWALIFRQLKPFLRSTYIQRVQFMSFMHKSLHLAVKEVFLENNPTLEQPYHRILADFYQHHSINRSIACRQGVYHLKELNDRASLFKFIKSKDCQMFVQNHERSRILDEMRCMFRIMGQDENNMIYMCFSCSISYDKMMIRPNKDSCFVCGGMYHDFGATNACYCMRHYKHNSIQFTCFVCGIMGSKTNPGLKPFNAKLCNFCSFSKKCCHIDL